MRLCYFADPCSEHTRRWVMHFAREGHEIHLVGTRSPDGEWPANWHFHRLQPYLPGEVPRWAWAVSNRVHAHDWVVATHWAAGAYRIRRLIEEIRPDLVHVHYISPELLYVFLSGFHPVVATAWGSDLYIAPGRYDAFQSQMLRLALRSADLITCDAEDLRQRAIDLGARPESTTLAQWGVDVSAFRPGLDASALAERWGLSGRWPRLLSIRKVRPIYNNDVILQAVARLRSRYPKVILIQPGAIPQDGYGEKLRGLIDSLELADYVRWIGYVPEGELPLLYNLADVCLSVPSSDSTAMSLLEAMACGTPLVVTDLPATREWGAAGLQAQLVPAQDTGAIAGAVINILDTPAGRREEAARVNRELILRKADRATHMKRMEELYHSLIQEVQARRQGMTFRLKTVPAINAALLVLLLRKYHGKQGYDRLSS